MGRRDKETNQFILCIWQPQISARRLHHLPAVWNHAHWESCGLGKRCADLKWLDKDQSQTDAAWKLPRNSHICYYKSKRSRTRFIWRLVYMNDFKSCTRNELLKVLTGTTINAVTFKLLRFVIAKYLWTFLYFGATKTWITCYRYLHTFGFALCTWSFREFCIAASHCWGYASYKLQLLSHTSYVQSFRGLCVQFFFYQHHIYNFISTCRLRSSRHCCGRHEWCFGNTGLEGDPALNHWSLFLVFESHSSVSLSLSE